MKIIDKRTCHSQSLILDAIWNPSVLELKIASFGRLSKHPKSELFVRIWNPKYLALNGLDFWTLLAVLNTTHSWTRRLSTIWIPGKSNIFIPTCKGMSLQLMPHHIPIQRKEHSIKPLSGPTIWSGSRNSTIQDIEDWRHSMNALRDTQSQEKPDIFSCAIKILVEIARWVWLTSGVASKLMRITCNYT